MKLIEALELLKRPLTGSGPEYKVFLACGFSPLHFRTFLTAELQSLLPDRRIHVSTGIFGDLSGNIERFEENVHASAVVIEWSDLDPRLGVRTLGGWRPQQLGDIVASVRTMVARLERAIVAMSKRTGIAAICMPALPLPPLFWASPARANLEMLELQAMVAAFGETLARHTSIRIANPQFLDEISAPYTRYDVKSDVTIGFPYSLAHASAMGRVVAELIQYRLPKKGLITDLDDTLWAGIVGEDGIDGISWDLDSKTHMHGLYQQFLASLAASGILVAAASKNDRAIVERAFERTDLLLAKGDIFPFEIHWSRKSESVARILRTWNVSPDSVVFVDDDAMELAEVRTAFPELECLVFPKNDYQGIWKLLKHLRGLFGKPLLTQDDAVRLRSIREGAEWRDAASPSSGAADDFLKNAGACVSFDFSQALADSRAFELINKTNQFNLNGQRYSEAEWRDFFRHPDAFLLTVSYKDKFGPLGKIAAILGRTYGRKLRLQTWVMSCRAFSRRIEYQCLRYLFESFEIDEIVLDYRATSRNQPIQKFIAELNGNLPSADVIISKRQFEASAPLLFHRVEGAVNV